MLQLHAFLKPQGEKISSSPTKEGRKTMKNIKKILASFLIAMLIIIGLFINSGKYVLAQAGDVELIGKAQGLVLVPEGRKLFDLGRLNPGDILKRSLKITNSYSKSFILYMRAERIGEKPEGPDLLDQLQLTVTYKGEVIYKGPASGKKGESGDLITNISLGSFDPRESRDLVAKIELPGPDTGNEFQGKTAEIKWIFTAQTSGDEEDKDKDNKDKPRNRRRDKGSDRDKDEPVKLQPPVEIDEEPIIEVEPEPEVFLESIDIPDEEVPMVSPDMPKTGEDLPYSYYVVGTFALVAGIGLTLRKKS